MLRKLVKEGGPYKTASGDPFVFRNNIGNSLENKQNIISLPNRAQKMREVKMREDQDVKNSQFFKSPQFSCGH